MGNIIKLRPHTIDSDRLIVDQRSRDEALRLLEEVIARCESTIGLYEGRAVSVERPRSDRSRPAFERFMDELAPTITEVEDGVRVRTNVSWVKIEGLATGHRVYVYRGKLAVGRVDCTLPPEMIEGAVAPGFKNGRIASWLPASSDVVCSAIRIIADPDTPHINER